MAKKLTSKNNRTALQKHTVIFESNTNTVIADLKDEIDNLKNSLGYPADCRVLVQFVLDFQYVPDESLGEASGLPDMVH